MQQSTSNVNGSATRRCSRTDNLLRLRQLVDRVPVCIVNTNGLDGFIHSRPMAYLHMGPDGDLHFFTRADSAKVEEVERDNRVSVTFSDPGSHLYVTVRGRAYVRRDRGFVERFFTPSMEFWFPGGIGDESLRVFVVDPDTAEYWQGPAGSTLLLDIARVAQASAAPAQPSMPH